MTSAIQTQLNSKGVGDVVGPASSTDNAAVRFDLTTGKLLQNSGIIIGDNNDVSGFNTVQYNTAPTSIPTTEGTAFWDATDHTISLRTDQTGVTLQVGQEMCVRARNSTGVTITNGSVVYVSGSTGLRPNITLAKADAFATSQGTIGMATHDIANNTDGIVTIVGLVRDLNTSAFLDGDVLYLSATTAGAVTNASPVSPNFIVEIGHVIKSHITQGIILVDITRPIVSSGVNTTVSGFNRLLSSADADVQKALDTLDNSALGASTTDTLTNKSISLGSNTLTGTSAQLITAISDETGSGSLVFATSPTLVTPTLGVATATSINKVAITAPATGSTLTIADGKTLTASNTLTFTGTDASSVAFGTGGTVLYSGGALGTPSSGTLTNATGLPVAGITASTVTALGVGSLEIGHATDTTLSRVSAGVAAIEGSNIMTVGSADTITGAKSFGSGNLKLNGATSGTLTVNAGTTTTSHTLTMPAAQGAASTVLTNDGAGNLSWASGGGSGWQLVSTQVVSGSDTQTVTFSSLDGNTAYEYMITGNVIGSVVGSIFVRANSVNHNTNRIIFYSDGATMANSSGSNTTGFALTATGTSENQYFDAILFAKTGQTRRVHSDFMISSAAGTPSRSGSVKGVWTDTTTNITSLQIYHEGGTGISIGSVISLYKRVP